MKLKRPTWAAKSYQVEECNLKHLKPAFGSLLLIDLAAEGHRGLPEDATEGRRLPQDDQPGGRHGPSHSAAASDVGGDPADVRMMAVHETAGKALSDDEERRLLEACRKRRSRALLPVVTLALHTGMRRGEIQALRWL